MSPETEPTGAAPAPTGRRYQHGREDRRSASRRRTWRATRAVIEALRENQWILPVAAIVLGAVLAWVLSWFGQDPDPGRWTIDVNRARDSLMAMLSLVFAGLSIVLAVATVTTQNVVGRFSLRMLRIYQRELRDKFVISTFAFTASFIMTEQVRLRAEPPDALAPVPGVAVSLLLIFVSGITLIWYLVVLSAWFRVDQTTRRVAIGALRGARSLEERYADLGSAGVGATRPRGEAAPVPAPRSGYFSGLDLDTLFELAVEHDARIVIERLDGSAVLGGESVGWIDSPDGTSVPVTADQLAAAVDISRSLTLEGATDYRITVLVDIAIMALSPAVNDPNTAVQVIDELTFLLPELATFELGPRAKTDEDGTVRIVVNARGFGGYVDLATEQIVLYGSTDPAVRRALERLLGVLETLDLSDSDASAVERLGQRLHQQGND